MENTNRLCLKELFIKQNKYSSSYFYSPKIRMSRYHFCIIEQGEVTLNYLNETINAKSGDVIFFPKGSQYFSQWHGTPKVIAWDLIFSFASDLPSHYTMQKLDSVEREIFDLAESLNKNLKSGDIKSISLGFADFYRLLGLILPKLTLTDAPFVSDVLKIAIDYMKANLRKDMKIEEIAKACNVCESTVYHIFRDELHTTPINYLNSLRLAQAIEYMRRNEKLKLSEISSLCGFNSDTHFRKTFYKITHMTPSEYRKSI